MLVSIIMLEMFANFFPVEMIFHVIMAAHAMVKLVNAAKNILVKVVICWLHVMDNHVKMMEHVMAKLKQMVLRSVS